MGDYSKLDRVKTMGTRGKINAISFDEILTLSLPTAVVHSVLGQWQVHWRFRLGR